MSLELVDHPFAVQSKDIDPDPVVRRRLDSLVVLVDPWLGSVLDRTALLPVLAIVIATLGDPGIALWLEET